MEPIAVVGLSFTLPQDVEDEGALWETLQQKTNLMTEWPDNRLDINSFHNSEAKTQNTVSNEKLGVDYEAYIDNTLKIPARGAHFVTQDPAAFDAPFFSITPAEASAMDPLHRWALESAYLAFENAGITMDRLRGSHTAVFAAAMSDEYKIISFKDPHTMHRTAATGLAATALPNRISWYFHLLGPSVLIDTACSGSLVALDLACQSLRSGDSSAALVLGANILLTPESTMVLGNMNFLSPDSRCYSFDHRANGYARGEGIVSLVLKPISEAIKSGDTIRAIIRSTGSNQDGHTPGITHPSSDAQTSLIRHVYKKAAIDLGWTRYVEAHGTGTPTGDPVEIRGIGLAFEDYRSPESPLYVGSAKTNFGHLEGGSGLVGVLKTIIVLEKGIIPPNALLEKVNPAIEADRFNIRIPAQDISWPQNGPRRASVNSFGFGGTNSHAVLDDVCNYLHSQCLEAHHQCQIDKREKPISNGSHCDNDQAARVPNAMNGQSNTTAAFKLLVWSAFDKGALNRSSQQFASYFATLHGADNSDFEQLVYTLTCRRTHLQWRSFAVVDTNRMALESSFATQPAIHSQASNQAAFVFTGQGAQYVGMGLDLLQYASFKKTLEDIDSIYASLGSSWSLFDGIHDSRHINSPEYSQPLSTALQLALVDLLKEFGLAPKAVVGHSSGEIAAAYTCGALSLVAACKVAYYRGVLAAKVKAVSSRPSAMMSVNLSEAVIPGYLAAFPLQCDWAEVTVACVNSPLNCTLSGPEETIDALQQHFDEKGIFARKLTTGVAYHSHVMAGIATEYLECLGSLEPGIGEGSGIMMVSSVSGQKVSHQTLMTGQYWADNLVSPVLFYAALRCLAEEPITDIVEIGPHPALRRATLDCIESFKAHRKPRYHSTLVKAKSPVYTTLELLGELFCNGYVVSMHTANHQSLNSLPTTKDCPRYPFDRSLRYWRESRSSRAFRRPGVGPLGLLGRRAHDWNPLEPRWRNVLTTESLPWLADHVINGTVIFPGAGSIVMAIQAAKQQTDPSRSISGYLIKEAHFIRPIFIAPDAENTEVMVHLTSGLGPAWFDIRIFSFMKDRWTECFTASVRVQYDEIRSDIDKGKEGNVKVARITSQFRAAIASCKKPISPDSFYHFTDDIGLTYGNAFRILNGIQWDGCDTAVAIVNPTSSSLAYAEGDNFHPTVLDAALQLALVPSSQDMGKTSPSLVPRHIAEMWISGKGHDTLRVKASVTTRPSRDKSGLDSKVSILDENGSPLCAIESAVMAPVQRNDERIATETMLLYGVDSKPAVSMLSPGQLRTQCRSYASTAVPGDDIIEYYTKFRSALAIALRKTLRELSDDDLRNAPNHIHNYLSSVKSIPLDDMMLPHHREDDVARILQECEEEKPDLRLGPTIARMLKPLITGDVDALDLIFRDGMAEDFYKHMFDQIHDERFRKFIELVTHERPGLRILEVGAGTGSMTSHVLSALKNLEASDGSTRFFSYMYTDITPVFFQGAAAKFQDAQDRMAFKTFDLEQDHLEQGFELGAYDIVFAGSVLHATSDLAKTLENLRKVLRPGGHLVFVEIESTFNPWINFIWGFLPGWWLSKEDFRKNTPLVSVERWDSLLRQAGFTGTDLVLKDYEQDDYHLWTMLTTTANRDSMQHPSRSLKLAVVVDPACHVQTLVAGRVIQSREGKVVTINDIDGIEWNDIDLVVSLVELDTPFLTSMPEAHFHQLKALIQAPTKLLWVASAHVAHGNYPLSNAMMGFFRSVRLENDEKHIVSLRFERDGVLTADAYSRHLLQAIDTVFQDAGSAEVEFVVRDGLFTIDRLTRRTSLQHKMRALASPQAREEEWLLGPPVKLDIETPGLLESLHFTDDSIFYHEGPAPEEVEIEAKAWPVSFRDLLIGLGRLEEETGRMGLECAGVVSRVGSACHDFRPGDHVVLIHSGSIRTYPRAHRKAVVKLPDAASLEHAASFVNPAMTAYQALITLAQLQEGEKVLIHSAAGSTGQMALWIAKMVGAEIFATVGYEDKRRLLIDKFGIPDSHIFSSRTLSFATGILRVTDGKGVDVVLNSLPREALQVSWECLAPYGRFIEIGKADILANGLLPMRQFRKNVSFHALDIQHIVESNLDLTHDLLTKTFDLVEKGLLQYPFPIHLFPLSKLEAAFRFMQSGKHMGRIIITTNPSDIVPKFVRSQSSWTFDPNACYLVAGGLGGVGRSVVTWMASKGARHLILLSRSGASSSTAKDFILRLQVDGIHVATPCCDVTSIASLSAALGELSGNMPPVKGCINAAFVLQDAVLDTMDYSQWDISVRTKVSSSWNLHEVLPKDMDFFVLLSSLTGVGGNVGQSNYATGCTVQDALARYRVLHNQKAVSFDLGWMRSIGIIAETRTYDQIRAFMGDKTPIEEAELLALLDIYCDPSLPVLPPDESQVVIGARTAADFIVLGQRPAVNTRRPLFSAYERPLSDTYGSMKEDTKEDTANLFQQAAGPEDKLRIVVEALRAKLGRLLYVSIDNIEASKSVWDYGVDSLVAVELRNWFRNEFRAGIAVLDIMGGKTILDIARLVVERNEY